jgi:hypothetical protein
MTPFGTPARSASSARASAENGVSEGGLITIVHPAARDAPSLRAIIAEGKFHGVRMELALVRIRSTSVEIYIHDAWGDTVSCTFERGYSKYQ